MNGFDKKKTAGFTMLELIIVMAIIMTLSAISITVIQMIARDQAMSKTTTRIENLIAKYRDAAMRTHDSYQIIFDRHRNSIRVFWCGPDGVLDRPGDANAGRDDELVEEMFLDWDMQFDKAVIEKQYMLDKDGNVMPAPPDDPDVGRPDYNGKIYDDEEEEEEEEEERVYATGVLILHTDGSIELAKMRPEPGNFEEVPLYKHGDDGTLEDEPLFNVSHSKFLDKVDAEIIISRIGDLRKVFIEINPYTGKVSTQITIMKYEDEDEEVDEE